MRTEFVELARRDGRWYEDDYLDITVDGKYRDDDLQALWVAFQTGAAVSSQPLIAALHTMLTRFDDSPDQFGQRYACAQARGALSLFVASQS